MFEKIKDYFVGIWEYLTDPIPTESSVLEEFCKGSGMSFWAWMIILIPYLLITKQRIGFIKN